MPPSVRDLLLAARLEPQQVESLLAPYGFKDPVKADRNLQQLATDPGDRQVLAEILEDLLSCIGKSADPDQALTYMERFAGAALNKSQLFSYLRAAPRMLEILARTLGASPYMAEILIRDPQHFYWITDPEILYNRRRKRDIEREMVRTLRMLDGERQKLDYLRTVKRREMLHIGVRDLLRLCSVEETLSALSTLAETLIGMCCSICNSELRREYGMPKNVLTGFTVLGMGKLGGCELNFSSDVDLVYLYRSDSETYGQVSAAEFFLRLSQKITAGLKEFTSEGYVYRVDLRLRPEGKAGYLAYSLDGFERYYRTRLATWERLALLKTWPVAGNRPLGRAFLQMATSFIYTASLNDGARQDIRTMKSKINQQMMVRDQRNRNVKLGTGGIREIELITQSLQIKHGAQLEELRERSTLKALSALLEHSLISRDEYDLLTTAYIFLRDVENKLQMANDAQTHSLPRDETELNVVARTLGYSGSEDFLRDYRRHTSDVNHVFESYFS